jgi:signal transduction histidine kinase
VIEVTTDPVPLDKRIKQSQVQDLLRLELQNQGISLPFEFGVFTGTDTVFLPIHSESFLLLDRHSAYKVNLFPNDAFAPATFLALKFPDKRAQLLRSVLWLLASSALLTLFIIVTFGMTVSFILKQKKISDIKSDFINNMTHEFKTPIATISLAADAIADDKILSDKGRVNYFLGIIRQENKRMNSQVENVLQMALLDKKDFALHFELLDIHELLKQSVTHISLQVEKLQGVLHSEFHADHHWLQTDRVHFTNLIYNLLDNAIKYSEGAPEISIATWNTKGGINISVEDKGIGLTPAEKSRIFEKFYRKATGNVHTVKGFGLGLSYVKAIVLLHKGEITVDSKAGKGSRFTVWLPGAVGG